MKGAEGSLCAVFHCGILIQMLKWKRSFKNARLTISFVTLRLQDWAKELYFVKQSVHSSSPKTDSLEAEHVTALQKKVQNNGVFFPVILETFNSELQLWVRNKLFSISTLCRWHRSQNILTTSCCCWCLFSKLFLCVFYTALQSPSVQLAVLSHAKTLILLWNPRKRQ